MGKSLSVGLTEILRLDPEVSSVTILPIDQPLISIEHLQALEKQSRATQRVAFTQSAEALGPPAVIPKRFFSKLLKLQADRGLKSVLQNGEWLAIQSEQALQDIDTKEDLLRMQQQDVQVPNCPL